MTEVPGGTVGCDVCGVILVEDKVSMHNEWHRAEDERLEALAQTVRELADKGGAATGPRFYAQSHE